MDEFHAFFSSIIYTSVRTWELYMCELLAMSANVPTDICFSFTGLIRRGGETGPHGDGFGICFYESGGLREFKDYQASATSPIAEFLRTYPIQSKIALSHIRQANVGGVSLQNTHPFQRELWGRAWTLAHNGQIDLSRVPDANFYCPVGTTDSEKIFCWLLDNLRQHATEQTPWTELADLLQKYCLQLNQLGVCNLLLSDGNGLFVFCSTKLSWLCRQAPFGPAHLCDRDLTVDFSSVTHIDDRVAVIATQPLTDNEDWHAMQSGEGRLFCDGVSIWQSFGPNRVHAKGAGL
jgi:predicted glutamine amidotransferase